MSVRPAVFFAIAFLSNALVPALMYRHLPEQKAEDLVNGNLRYQFEDLARRYPESFEAAYGTPPARPEEREAWFNQKCADTLRVGRKIYVGEGSNEERRWGPVAYSAEFQNELQRPVLFGTRRVGPDLSREGGRRSNDWHAVHFFRPKDVSADSPMPNYPWFFDGASNRPNARGLAILTYVQWLGSWLESYPYYEQYEPSPLLKIETPKE